MSNELMIEIIKAAVKFGFDATIALITNLKSATTIDDAIAALNAAKQKTIEQYIEEDKAQG